MLANVEGTVDSSCSELPRDRESWFTITGVHYNQVTSFIVNFFTPVIANFLVFLKIFKFTHNMTTRWAKMYNVIFSRKNIFPRLWRHWRGKIAIFTSKCPLYYIDLDRDSIN